MLSGRPRPSQLQQYFPEIDIIRHMAFFGLLMALNQLTRSLYFMFIYRRLSVSFTRVFFGVGSRTREKIHLSFTNANRVSRQIGSHRKLVEVTLKVARNRPRLVPEDDWHKLLR